MTSKFQSSVSFSFTAHDYTNALRLMMRNRLLNIRVKVILAVLIIIAVLGISISDRNSSMGANAITLMILIVYSIIMYVLVYVFFLPRKARRIFRLQKTMQYPVEVSWSREAYSESTAICSSTVPWLDYYAWRADKTIILLMHSPVLVQMVPRRALSVEQEKDLFEHLDRSGLRKIR